jgi:hypothetical protein
MLVTAGIIIFTPNRAIYATSTITCGLRQPETCRPR